MRRLTGRKGLCSNLPSARKVTDTEDHPCMGAHAGENPQPPHSAPARLSLTCLIQKMGTMADEIGVGIIKGS